MNQVCRCTHLPHADFISIGFESPAGQTYSSAADLGKVMALIFSSDEPQEGQVRISNSIYIMLKTIHDVITLRLTHNI